MPFKDNPAIMPRQTRYLKLPLRFDLPRLQDDLTRIRESEWIPHFNTDAYEDVWRCVPLRSLEGRTDHILSLSGVPYADTAILARCPYFQEVVDSFECEKTSIRLMALGPGARIRMHVDPGTSFEEGIVRLHVPIATSPAVRFLVEDEEVHFSAGDTWYLNAECRHGVVNDSPNPRVHLMLDCVANPWLERVLLEAGFEPAEKPKYGDPSINDNNVSAVIARLMALEGDAGLRLAQELAVIRDQGARP